MEYQLIKSKRKTMSIEIKLDGRIVVRAPLRASKASVVRFLEEHRDWIVNHYKKIREDMEQGGEINPLSPEDIRKLADEAMKIIPQRVAYYAPLIGVTYKRITIRNQKTRWGSCSSKGNLNFNCLLMLTPPEVLDSVVVHELCHLKHMNHSKDFYAEILKVFPDYRIHDKWLKENGNKLMRRMC